MLQTRMKARDRLRWGPVVLALVATIPGASCSPDKTDPLGPSAPAEEPGEVVPTEPDTGTTTADTGATTGDTGTTTVEPVTYSGIPFGPVGLWGAYTEVKWGPGPFTQSQNSDDALGAVSRINAARSLGQRLVLNLTGGGAQYYTTNGKFDMAKWKNKMNTYDSTTIKDAVAAGVSDGTIIGNMLIDEPETKRWGGNITKAMIDEMATYAKQIFPTLPVGINHGPPGYTWRSTEHYQVLDYVLYQYNYWVNSGNVTSWRDAVLSQARADGVRPALGVNILDGGVPDFDGTWDCTGAGQAGKGTYSHMCRMTTDQLRTWGEALTTYGCFMLLWMYDGTYMSNSANQDAFRELASLAASQPLPTCSRP